MPFRLASGAGILLDLEIHDDMNTESEMLAVYQQLIDAGSVDFLVGPYSSGLSLEAARVANSSNKIIMMHGASSSVVYEQGYPLVFSTNVMAQNYMVDGLRLLRALNASTMATVWDYSVFSESVCRGAAASARSLGYEVLSELTFSAMDLTSGIRQSAASLPDVFVACGQISFAVNLAVTSRALDFNPKAILATQAPTEPFVQAVGAANANYMLGPVTWSRQRLDSQCRVFGSAAGFAESYRTRFGTYPEYHSAQAAAAGLALLAAVEKHGQWPAGTPAIEKALRALDMQSFYKRLAFNENGTLVNATASTLQVQPLSASAPPAQRYLHSQYAQVDNETHPPLYPSPSWDQKELAIFPCGAGEMLSPNLQNVTCLPCPAGTQRRADQLECRPCGIGLYGPKEGMAICEVCPEGANCSSNQIAGMPPAAEGYYLLPEMRGEKPMYRRCDQEGLCLGDNRCHGENQGILCHQCKPGFINTGFSLGSPSLTCISCPDLGVMVVTIIFGGLLFITYIAAIAHATLASSESVRAISSIVLKMIVNYCQLSATAVEACEFNSFAVGTFAVDWALNPVGGLFSFECLLDGTGIRTHEAMVFVGICLVPVALVMNFFFFFCFFYFKLVRIKQKGSQGVYHMRKFNPTRSREGLGMSTVDPVQAEQWNMAQGLLFVAIQWAVVWIFILYPIVVRMLLEGLSCIELDVLRLKHNYDVQCRSGAHQTWVTLSICCLILFGLGLPLYTFILLRRVRDRLMTRRVRNIYGFLYNGFEQQWYFFEVVHMIRKLTILVCATTIPSLPMRILVMLLLSFTFLAIHIRCEPYDNRDHFVLDRLETAGLAALITTLGLQMFFVIREELRRPGATIVAEVMSSKLFDGLLYFVVGCVHTYFWALALWSLLRNAVMKHLHFKDQCLPEGVTGCRSMILMLEPYMNSFWWDTNIECLHLEKLTNSERNFLFFTLRDVMDWYIKSGTNFHAGRITTAIRAALDMCIEERSKRAEHLHEILSSRKESQPGWRGMIQRSWQEMRHALKGQRLELRHFSPKAAAATDEGSSQGTQSRVATTFRRLGSKLSASGLAHLRPPVTRRNNKTATNAASQRARTTNFVVEELQNSLMMTEDDIVRGHFFYQEIAEVKNAPVEEGAAGDQGSSLFPPSSQPDDAPQVAEEPSAIPADAAEEPVRVDSELEREAEVPYHAIASRVGFDERVLVDRRAELLVERERLRAEVRLLQRELAGLEGQQDVSGEAAEADTMVLSTLGMEAGGGPAVDSAADAGS